MNISHAQLCSINSLNSDGIISENDSLGLKQKELFFCQKLTILQEREKLPKSSKNLEEE